MSKVLVIDDDKNICELLKLYLISENFEVSLAHDGSSALDKVEETKPDLIILDVMLPVINGWEVLKLIRKDSNTPVIMISALDTTENKIMGLDNGADDYIVKPFEPKEVIARVKANIRRVLYSQEITESDNIVTVGNLYINMDKYEITLDDKVLTDLKPKEVQLLYFLAKNKNIVLTREQLLDKVWGYDFMGETRTVDVHIKNLREKIESPTNTWAIVTIWGVGYKLETK